MLDEIRVRVAAYPSWDRVDDLGGWQGGTSLAFLRRAAERWTDGYDGRAPTPSNLRPPRALRRRCRGRRHGRRPVTARVRLVRAAAVAQERRKEAAQLLQLMTEVLGHERFVVQGGDWGSYIAGWLGVDHPDAVEGIHVSALNLRPPGAPAGATTWPDDFTEDVQWTTPPRGGHFAAFQESTLWTADVQSFLTRLTRRSAWPGRQADLNGLRGQAAAAGTRRWLWAA